MTDWQPGVWCITSEASPAADQLIMRSLSWLVASGACLQVCVSNIGQQVMIRAGLRSFGTGVDIGRSAHGRKLRLSPSEYLPVHAATEGNELRSFLGFSTTALHVHASPCHGTAGSVVPE